MTVQQVVRKYREDLLTREAVALVQIRRAWDTAELAMFERLLVLLDRLAEDRPRQPISWLIEQQRLQILLGQVAEQIGNASEITSSLITGAQVDAVAMASAAAQEYFEASGGVARIGAEWNWLSAPGLEQFVGRMSDGSPLPEALKKYGDDAAKVIEDEITTAIATGKNPREAARQIRKAIKRKEAGASITDEIVEGPAKPVAEQAKALTQKSEVIARTEIVSSHRSAAVANYRENFSTCIGYRRIAALDVRTCPACWALHGRLYLLEVDPHEHPQCRCTVIPEFETSDPVESGEEAFKRLTPDQKREILGPGKLRLYRSGKAKLTDFAETFDDEQWGPQVREQSLRAIEEKIDA